MRWFVRYQLLGQVAVEHGGAQLNLGGTQQRRLLAVLLSRRGEVVRVANLVDALWPDGREPQGAARSVLTYISRLRAALGPGATLDTLPHGYRLAPLSSEVDAEQFESLLAAADRLLPDAAVPAYDEALALWRGSPFAEFADEWWALAHVTRLQELHLAARESRAAALLSLGRGSAVADLELLVAEQPTRERSVSLLMQSLLSTGRRSEALSVYREFYLRLAEDTGLEPSDEIAALARAAAAGDPHPVGPGRALRGYTLYEKIGQGSSGFVYAAVEPGTNRRVAVKVIRPEYADSADYIRRFEAEAQVIARLEHPHIVPLYDYWREPGGAYLVMRHLSGGTARQVLIAGGVWSLRHVSRFVEEVGGALVTAHASGVVHRDVRLSNVLLDKDGTCYLADFGIAATASDADETADLRGLARCVHELLTGRRDLAPGISLPTPGDAHHLPRLVGFDAYPGLDPVLERASRGAGGYESVAEFILSWRAATGRPDGELSPLGSGTRRAVDDVRRVEAAAMARGAGLNPYCGLRPFGAAEARSFFGRDHEIADVLALLDRHPMVSVVGASGSGKSSLVRAGVVPALRQQGRLVVAITPGEAPDPALDEALREVAETGTPAEALLTSGSGLVVVIDQFEECWTLCADEVRDRFLTRIAAAIASGVQVLTTIRADLFDRPLADPSIGRRVTEGTYALTGLSPAELGVAVRMPAHQVCVEVEDTVVSALVGEASRQVGVLPLLQFTLTELFDLRRDGRITEETLTELGGMTGALGRRAEDAYGQLDVDAQRVVRAVLSRFVVPVDGEPDARRRARISELPAGSAPAVDAFVSARLLVTDRDPGTREPTIEVAHEALFQAWPRLSGWLQEDHAWLAQLHHLSGAARVWDAGGQVATDLYSPPRLQLVQETLALGDRHLSDCEQRFVAASAQARDAQQALERSRVARVRRALAGVVAALVIALLAGVVAVSQWRTADHSAAVASTTARSAKIEALVGRAEHLRLTHRDAAALLAIEAFRLADTPTTRAQMLSTFTASNGYLDTHVLPGAADVSRTGMVMPDGVTAFAAGPDRLFHDYDIDSGALGPALPSLGAGLDPVALMAGSADGTRLAVLQAQDPQRTNTVVGVIDLTTRKALLERPIAHSGANGAGVALSADGRILYASWVDGSAAAYQVPSGKLLAARPPATSDDPGAPNGGLALLGDSTLVLGGTTSVRVLDAHTLAVRRTIEVPPASALTISDAGAGRVVGNGPGGTTAIDLGAGRVLWKVDGLECRSAVASPTAGTFYCGDPTGRLQELDVATGAVRRELDAQNGEVQALWRARDDTELVAFSSDRPVVSRWRLDGGNGITATLPGDQSLTALSADGSTAVLATRHPGAPPIQEWGSLRVVSTRTGAVIRALPDDVIAAGWTAGDHLVGARTLPSGLTQLVDLGEGGVRPGSTFPAYTGGGVAPGYDVVPNNGLRGLDPAKPLWFAVQYQDGQRFTVLQGSKILSSTYFEAQSAGVDVTGDGKTVVTGSFDGIGIFDGASGRLRKRLEPEAGVIARIGRGGHLITATMSGDLRVFDLDSLDLVRSLPGSGGAITHFATSADDRLLVASGDDHRIALYDTDTGLQYGTPMTTAPSETTFVALSLDGTTLAYGGGQGAAVKVMSLAADDLVSAACRIAGRNLTAQEWLDNIGDLAPHRATCPQFS
ncbi:MAG: BTAD domain-containing putative transcriptional regulator [Dermatophilaceae bacterium]